VQSGDRGRSARLPNQSHARNAQKLCLRDGQHSQWAMPGGTVMGGLSQVGSIAHQRQEGGRGPVEFGPRHREPIEDRVIMAQRPEDPA
jgi:hypothetical protein